MTLPMYAGLLAAVLALGFLDQAYPTFVPDYGETAAQWNNDARFAAEIEHRLPRNASVFELPYADFPEGHTPGSTADYDLVRPYLHTRHLTWSFGAMRGRPADWAAQLADAPLERVLPAIAAVGFDGIYVDTAGYPNDGEATLRRLGGLLQTEPLISDDRRYAFYDLREYQQHLRASRSPASLRDLRSQVLELGNRRSENQRP